MFKTVYKIVIVEHIEELEERVNLLLLDRWQVTGGISIALLDPGTGRYKWEGNRYAQALIRIEIEED